MLFIDKTIFQPYSLNYEIHLVICLCFFSVCICDIFMCARAVCARIILTNSYNLKTWLKPFNMQIILPNLRITDIFNQKYIYNPSNALRHSQFGWNYSFLPLKWLKFTQQYCYMQWRRSHGKCLEWFNRQTMETS